MDSAIGDDAFEGFQFLFFGFPGRLLGQLVGALLLDFALQFLDHLVPVIGVILKFLGDPLGQFAQSLGLLLGLLKSHLIGVVLGLGNIALFVQPLRLFQALLGAGQFGLGPLDRAFDGLHVLKRVFFSPLVSGDS